MATACSHYLGLVLKSSTMLKCDNQGAIQLLIIRYITLGRSISTLSLIIFKVLWQMVFFLWSIVLQNSMPSISSPNPWKKRSMCILVLFLGQGKLSSMGSSSGSFIPYCYGGIFSQPLLRVSVEIFYIPWKVIIPLYYIGICLQSYVKE